jgi:uncharacterized membrane protein
MKLVLKAIWNITQPLPLIVGIILAAGIMSVSTIKYPVLTFTLFGGAALAFLVADVVREYRRLKSHVG